MERIAAPLTAVGRVLIAALFLWDAALSFEDIGGSIGYVATGLPLPELAFWAAMAVQIAGGLALVAGFMTRWAALALALYCLATALFFHTHWADLDMKIHFFKNLAIAGGLVALAASGGGAWSWDARRGLSKEPFL